MDAFFEQQPTLQGANAIQHDLASWCLSVCFCAWVTIRMRNIVLRRIRKIWRFDEKVKQIYCASRSVRIRHIEGIRNWDICLLNISIAFLYLSQSLKLLLQQTPDQQNYVVSRNSVAAICAVDSLLINVAWPKLSTKARSGNLRTALPRSKRSLVPSIRHATSHTSHCNTLHGL
jgi:hypothetical protein